MTLLAKSDDLEIRTLELGDLSYRVQCINDPIVAHTTNFDLPVTLEQTESWFRTLVTRNDRLDASIISRGELVGFCALLNIDSRSRRAEIHCFLGSEHHGHGIGTSVHGMLAEYGFSCLGLQRVYAYTLHYNQAVLRMLDKLGWTLEGTLRRDVLHDGQYLDRHILALLKDDPGAHRGHELWGPSVVPPVRAV